MKNYTYKQFNKDFPDDDVCLDYVFKSRFADYKCPKCGKSEFYRIKGRKMYACACGYQISPLAGTVLHKSSTKLTDWFYATYLFSASKNGVSAKELERQLGVTYKCAWRIAKQIRTAMKQGKSLLSGTVECDETYFGGRKRMKEKMTNKSAVMGMVERKGRVIAKKIPNRETHIILNNIQDNVEVGSQIMSDEFQVYKKTTHMGYSHACVKHGKRHYVLGDIHTNSVEGFWGQLKRSIDGTHHSVSSKYSQSYVDEFVFRYNHRGEIVFPVLLGALVR